MFRSKRRKKSPAIAPPASVDGAYPPASTSIGSTSIIVVAEIAHPSRPTVAEVTGPGSYDLSLFMYGDCLTPVSPDTFPDLSYVYDPQGDDFALANAARVILTEGSLAHLVIRRGLSARGVQLKAGQRVETWTVRLGAQTAEVTGCDDFAEHAIHQPVTVLAGPVDGVLSDLPVLPPFAPPAADNYDFAAAVREQTATISKMSAAIRQAARDGARKGGR